MPKSKPAKPQPPAPTPDGPRGGWPIRLVIPPDARVKAIPAEAIPAAPVAEHKHFGTPERIPPAR